MPRFSEVRAALSEGQGRAATPEPTGKVTPLHSAPDSVPEDVWRLMQENGRKATELLHDLLHSSRWHRLKPSDQAKLIHLAQSRAYGTPDAVMRERIAKRGGMVVDATAESLNTLAARATLPEYARGGSVLPEEAQVAPEATPTPDSDKTPVSGPLSDDPDTV